MDEQVIEKIYVLYGSEQELLSDLPAEIMEMADKIVSRAQATLDKKLNDSLFLALADHLQGVVL